MKIHQKYYHLSQLSGAYFYQSWPMDYSDCGEVISDFIDLSPLDIINATIADIDKITTPENIQELGEFVNCTSNFIAFPDSTDLSNVASYLQGWAAKMRSSLALPSKS